MSIGIHTSGRRRISVRNAITNSLTRDTGTKAQRRGDRNSGTG